VAQFIIYTLSDPRDGEIRYVGKTEGPLAKRMVHHMWRAGHGKRQYVYCWIRKLLADGVRPDARVVEEVGDHDSLVAAERRWIEELKTGGARLTDLTEGGEGAVGYRHTEASKKKMSDFKKGKKFNWNPARKILPEHIPAIVKRYLDGDSATRIAADRGVSHVVILRHLRKAGVQTRNAAEQRWVTTKRAA